MGCKQMTTTRKGWLAIYQDRWDGEERRSQCECNVRARAFWSLASNLAAKCMLYEEIRDASERVDPVEDKETYDLVGVEDEWRN